MTNLENALAFFDLCEKGAGWENCKSYCAHNATFRGQGGAFHPPVAPEPNLGGTVENYVGWMKMIYHDVMPKCYLTDVVSAYDAKTSTALIFGVFHGTHSKTPEGAPLPPPTNKSTTSDYVYKFHFNSQGKIDSMVKIWNSEWASKELGWIE